jgi:hypothetical protein
MEPLDELKYIQDQIDRYKPTDSGYELETLVNRAIVIVGQLPTNSTNQDYESHRSELIEDLTHTLNNEVKNFAILKQASGKKEQLRVAKLMLTSDIKSFLSSPET